MILKDIAKNSKDNKGKNFNNDQYHYNIYHIVGNFGREKFWQIAKILVIGRF